MPGFMTTVSLTAVTTSPGRTPPNDRRGGSSPAFSPGLPGSTLCTMAPLGTFSVRATASFATCTAPARGKASVSVQTDLGNTFCQGVRPLCRSIQSPAL